MIPKLENHYTDTDGKEKILYHNGYVNYTETMKKVMEQAGINDADTVLVTGYSAGGFGPAGWWCVYKLFPGCKKQKCARRCILTSE